MQGIDIKIGIDGILLKALNIGQANIRTLKDNNVLVIEGKGSKETRILKDSETGEDLPINYIKISDTSNGTYLFTGLKIGARDVGGIKNIEYEHLSTVMPLTGKF